MRAARSAFPALAAAFLAGCVAVPPGSVDGPMTELPQPLEAPYKSLDPGYKTHESQHFLVSAYSSEIAAAYSTVSEDSYRRIMNDLGLYSFVPARPYNITVYRDAAEYRSKTGQPDWSGGMAYGNAILLYEAPGAAAIIAHEMAHLVFNEYMGLAASSSLRWINEGVAVYSETRASYSSAAFYREKVRSAVEPNPMPFSQMINLAPSKETDRTVDRWYAQAGSVAGFMIETGGSLPFSIFLSRLRDGASADSALAAAYPGLWKDLKDLEKAWLLKLRN